MTFDYDVTRLPILFSEGIQDEPPRRRAVAPAPRGATMLRGLLRLLRRGLTPPPAVDARRQARPMH